MATVTLEANNGPQLDVYARQGNSGGQLDDGFPTTLTGVHSYTGTWASNEAHRYGLAFQFPETYSFSSEGIILDPPVIKSATIRLTARFNSLPGTLINFYLEQSVEETTWSGFVGIKPPDSISTFSAKHHLKVFIDEAWQDSWTVPSVAGTNETFNLPLDPIQFNKLTNGEFGTLTPNGSWFIGIQIAESQEFAGLTTTSPSVLTPVHSVDFRNHTWNVPARLPALVVEYEPFHTGTHTGRTDRTRAVRDARLGIPAMSADLVEDGYLEGIWVNPWDRDPKDTEDQNTNNPSNAERVTDGKPVR